MNTIYLVTGNAGKRAEWERLLPSSLKLRFIDLDLPEIQENDLEAIAIDKAKRAFVQVKKPVLVEDIAAGLTSLKGLPGPFIKYFELRMGNDALYQLAKKTGDDAIVTCTIAYYDGVQAFAVTAEVHGSVAPARGTHGFGFDSCFVPEGQNKTYGEMAPQEKDMLSHRAKGIKLLVNRLQRV